MKLLASSAGMLAAVGIAAAGLGFVAMPQPAAAQPSSCYANYIHNSGAVRIEACQYQTGSSGYIKVHNQTNNDVKVCWTLHFGDGSRQAGCNSSLRARDTARSSCYKCNRQHKGGLVDVTFRSLR